MTNYERYKKAILELKGDFALRRNTREVCKCSDITCTTCHFNDYTRPACSAIKLVWLYDEYKDETDPEVQRLTELYNTITEHCNSLDYCNKCMYGYTIPGDIMFCDYIEDEYERLGLGKDD